MKQEAKLPWTLWGILTAAAAVLLVGVVLAEEETLTPLGWVSLMIGMAPLIGAQLALGVPGAAAQVQGWLRERPRPLWPAAGSISVLFLISGILTPGFDPYAAVIAIVGIFAALGTLRQIERGKQGLTWADGAVWLLLWIPFDLRWSYDLWFGVDGFAYHWWSVAVSVLALLGWYGLRQLPDFGYRLVPRRSDFLATLLPFVIFAAIVIPIGLAIDFLTFPPTTPFSMTAVLFQFIGLFLTVAIPEEIFFRGILLHGLDQMYQRPWLTLFLSSLAFGLMHWNNAGDLTTQIAYCTLATLAGMFYGWAYRRSGNNLLAAVLVHTLVDVMWQFLFQ